MLLEVDDDERDEDLDGMIDVIIAVVFDALRYNVDLICRRLVLNLINIYYYGRC